MSKQASQDLDPESVDAASVPKVSVAMITYNHEKFIGQAIESVLMQVTGFPIELVIGEDCSTDNTREIVRQYAEAKPEIVRPLLHQTNLGVGENLMAVFAACRGEYIAVLEGDDYWTDPHKLKKQVELLESNPEYSMCGTAARDIIVDPDGGEQEAGLFPHRNPKSLYSLEDVLTAYPFRTLTFLFRKGLVKYPQWLSRVSNCDICILALYAEKGPIAYLDDVTGAYRIHDGGIWRGSSSLDRYKATRVMVDALGKHFSGRYARIWVRRGFHFFEEFCLEGVVNDQLVEVKKIFRESFKRFVFRMPISYLKLGISVYGGHRFIMACNQLTKHMAIRTRIRRLVGR